MVFFSIKIPSYLLTRVKTMTVQLHLVSPSMRVLLSPRKKTFWYLLSTGTKIKNSCRLEFIFIQLVYLHDWTNLWSMLLALLIYSIFQVWNFRITPSPNCSGITSGLSFIWKGRGYYQGKTYVFKWKWICISNQSGLNEIRLTHGSKSVRFKWVSYAVNSI